MMPTHRHRDPENTVLLIEAFDPFVHCTTGGYDQDPRVLVILLQLLQQLQAIAVRQVQVQQDNVIVVCGELLFSDGA